MRAIFQHFSITLCWLIVACVFPLQNTEAQQKPNALLIETLSIDFSPKEAFFLIYNSEGAPLRSRAFSIKLREHLDSDGKSLWAFSTLLRPQDLDADGQFVIIAESPTGKVVAGALKSLEEAPSDIARLTPEALRELVLQRQGALAALQLQLQAQTEELQRVQKDAELIGGYGKVLSERAKLHTLTVSLTQAEADEILLTKLLKLAQARSGISPKNARSRESQLTQQTKELAEAAQKAARASKEEASGINETTPLAELLAATENESEEKLAVELALVKAELKEVLATKGLPDKSQ
jgi:hypothetical protein